MDNKHSVMNDLDDGLPSCLYWSPMINRGLKVSAIRLSHDTPFSIYKIATPLANSNPKQPIHTNVCSARLSVHVFSMSRAEQASLRHFRQQIIFCDDQKNWACWNFANLPPWRVGAPLYTLDRRLLWPTCKSLKHYPLRPLKLDATMSCGWIFVMYRT